MKNKLMSLAPWRGEEEEVYVFANTKLKVTKEPGSTPTMHVPAKKPTSSKSEEHKDSFMEISPELKYGFQRNYKFLQQVFSMDTLLKPLPLSMQYNATRNLKFLVCIFTQFTDPGGISNVYKSLGLGQEEKYRRVSDQNICQTRG